MDRVIQQTHTAGVRDVAVQKLRDVTIAVAIAAAAGVGAIAWVSAATIPGFSGSSGVTGSAATEVGDRPASATGDEFAQAPPSRARFGPGVVVSGGSR
jgi:hypothetical protein